MRYVTGNKSPYRDAGKLLHFVRFLVRLRAYGMAMSVRLILIYNIK